MERCARLIVVVSVLASASAVTHAEELVLDRARVIEHARARAPAVRVAEARLAEARAAETGAHAPAAPNPEIGIVAGPRWLPTGATADVVGSLLLPIDLSGAPTLRARVARERARAAEAAAEDARRLAVGAALDAWLAALGADERVQLERERAQLDEALYASARARRQAGTIGDLDLQLTAVLRADSAARLSRAEGERVAALVSLQARIGLPAQASVRLDGTLDADAAPPLDALLARLPQRPDHQRAQVELEVAASDVRLQNRLRVPAPRVTASGGRDPESFARFGVDLPLPLYQRNQTARAVATAHRDTVAAERVLIDTAAEAELRAAYAGYLAARRAYEVLHEAAPSMRDAEHLATRAYELGQATLPNLILARRETAAARVAHLDARIALARARVAVDVAAGVIP